MNTCNVAHKLIISRKYMPTPTPTHTYFYARLDKDKNDDGVTVVMSNYSTSDKADIIPTL